MVTTFGPKTSIMTRLGRVRRGRLEVVVASSTCSQELIFQKGAILESLRESLPEANIRDLRLTVGAVD